MLSANMMRMRTGVGAIVFVLGLIASVQAEEISQLMPKQLPTTTRILSFPSDQCMGNLSLEPESGPGWDPEGVRLLGQWDYLSAAQGDVRVPKDRNAQLMVRLALSPHEMAKLRAQNPRAYRMTIADRTREDPYDLSGLRELGPNDLFWLSIGSEMYQRTGVSPGQLKPIRHLTGLQILTLYSTGVTDECLEQLRTLRSLRGLELTQTSIGSRGLAVLKDLPALEYLQLNTGVTDAGLKQVAQVSRLRWLRIGGGKMWGPGLAELVKLPRLERLCFWGGRGGTPLSDRHIKHLEGLTQLKGLTLHSVHALTDASLASIGKLKGLEELHFIRSSPRFTATGVAHLRTLEKLKKVDFSFAWSRPEGVKHGDEIARQLALALPHVESIRGICYLSDKGMKTLTTFRNLKCLNVGLKDRGQDYHGPTGLPYLASLGDLEELSIGSGETLSEADLDGLAPLSRLRDLRILGPGVTDRALASIGKLRGLEYLDLRAQTHNGALASLGTLKNLERLYLRTLTRKGLNHLNALSNLEYLGVSVLARGIADQTEPADELMLDLSRLKKIKDLGLGLSLQDSDLAFLKHLPLLEGLSIGSNAAPSVTGPCLAHLQGLPELGSLYVYGLSSCTGADLAHLNGLSKLRRLELRGNITDSALASLNGAASLWSLRVETDKPIRKETVTDLTESHPVIEYIHIEEPRKASTQAPQQRERSRVNQSRTNRRTPAKRRREKR